MILQNERFKELSEKLGGFNQEHIHSFFYWNNPFELKHWTMNVVELLLIGGAIFGLLHAIYWYKTKRDPSNLCVWIATIIYVLIIEPILYFPELFYLDSLFKVIFIHNEFTAGILFNRTPIYILALYPATIYTSFVLVQRLNIFEKPNGLILGAICVGFTNHVFYEIFDHFGPQYGWWLWDYELNISKPALGSVPLYSLVGFSLNGAIAIAFLAKRDVVDYAQREGWTGRSLAWRTFRAGSRTPLFLALFTPQLIYTFFADDPNVALISSIYYVQLAVLASIALYTFWQADWGVINDQNKNNRVSLFPLYFFSFFLLVFAGLWLFALDEYLSATNGITSRGTPTGSLAYVVFCYIAGIFILSKAYLGKFVFAANKNPVLTGGTEAQPEASGSLKNLQ